MEEVKLVLVLPRSMADRLQAIADDLLDELNNVILGMLDAALEVIEREMREPEEG